VFFSFSFYIHIGFRSTDAFSSLYLFPLPSFFLSMFSSTYHDFIFSGKGYVGGCSKREILQRKKKMKRGYKLVDNVAGRRGVPS